MSILQKSDFTHVFSFYYVITHDCQLTFNLFLDAFSIISPPYSTDVSGVKEYIDVYKDDATEFVSHYDGVYIMSLEVDAENNAYTWYSGEIATTFTTDKNQGQSIESINVEVTVYGIFLNFGKLWIFTDSSIAM